MTLSNKQVSSQRVTCSIFRESELTSLKMATGFLLTLKMGDEFSLLLEVYYITALKTRPSTTHVAEEIGDQKAN